MLTQDELATIRAALRFWRDEMVSVGEDTCRHYFDVSPIPNLNELEIESLIERLQSLDS